MPAQSIDDVILALDRIVEECKIKQDKVGYFAVLYRKVTIRVREGIEKKEFEDNARMEKLDVLFGNRYLEAYEAYKQQQPCSACWKVAFDASHEKGRMILQHLLLGINAHINLDLGIAALDTTGATNLASIKNDFMAINAILGQLVEDVKADMIQLSPVFKWLMPLVKKSDEMLIKFTINIARDGAWQFATQLAQSNRDAVSIQKRDQAIALLGSKLRSPGRSLNWVARMISLAEWRSVRDDLSILER